MPYREGGNSVLTGDLSRINRTIKAVRQSEFDKTSIKDPVITTLKSLRKTLPTRTGPQPLVSLGLRATTTL